MIVKTKREEYEVLKHMALLLPKHFSEKISQKLKAPEEAMMKNQSLLKKPMTIEDIQKRR